MPTILIIEDNVDFRETLKEMLELEGYDVVEAPDGRAGINMYRNNPVGLVITDIIMPEVDGIEAIMELRQDYPDVKIITISGGGRTFPDPELFLSAAEELGSIQSFMKPLDRVAFMAVVREALPLSGD
ncbi:MAG: response regulator [Desulfobulbaceae bacterium]|nr:response regulator [Desulfobulbaceae bacterium]